MLFPFYWMLLTSLKSYASYNAERTPVFLPLSPTLGELRERLYRRAFGGLPVKHPDLLPGHHRGDGGGEHPGGLRLRPAPLPGEEPGVRPLSLHDDDPTELVAITNFVTITNLDLRNTFLGLILPSITSVFYIYLLKENFEQVPEELYKAAKVDGTSDLKYLWKVMIPICRPTLVTITILKLIECWNSYVWPRLITDDPAYYLVSNGIQEIRENGFGRENVPAMMAAVVVSACR